MPRNPDHEQINVVLTQRQHDVLLRYAEARAIGVSDAIRAALMLLVPGFPDDMPQRGTYKRKPDERRPD